MSNYTTAIDFGTAKISLAVGESRPDGLHILFCDSVPSAGIRNGEIENDYQVRKALQPLKAAAEEATGEMITGAVVSISGKFVKTADIIGTDQRKDPNRQILDADVRALDQKQYSGAAEGNAVLEVTPQKYDVDDINGMDAAEVDGIRGCTLTGHYKTFYGKEALLSRRKNVIRDSNMTLQKVVLSPIASARAVLTTQEMENGVALVDIGKGLTEVAVIKDNIIRDIAVVPFGGASVTNDIKNVTSLSEKWAENIKVRHGLCLVEKTPDNKILELSDEDGSIAGTVELQLLTRVIEARMSEILDAVAYILDKSAYSKKLLSGVVITGGCAYSSYLLPLARGILDRKCRLAAPRVTDDSVDKAKDADYSTVVGLLVEWFDNKLSTTSNTEVATRPVAQQPQTSNTDLFGGQMPEPEKPQPSRPKEPSTPKPGNGKQGGLGGWLKNNIGNLFDDNGKGNEI